MTMIKSTINTKNEVTVVKSGMKHGVINADNIVLNTQFESIDILENGWIVAGANGLYDIYDKNGKRYWSLSFLKRSNAIQFARDL